jgi:hypothetical protein
MAFFMMPSPALFNLRCPSCSQIFLSSQQSQTGSPITCPHCAFSAELTAFQLLQSGPLAEAVPLQRRRPRQDETSPAPATRPLSVPLIQPPERSQPMTANLSTYPSNAPALTKAAEVPTNWQPPTSGNKTRLTLILLSIAAIAAAVFIFLQRENAITQPIEDYRSSELEVIKERFTPGKRELPKTSTIEYKPKATAPVLPLDRLAASKAAEDLLKRFFTSGSETERRDCFAEGSLYGDDIQRWRDSIQPAPKMTRSIVARSDAFTLPGNQPVTLVQVATEQNKSGAIMMVTQSQKNRFLLDWPLFRDSHENRLKQFVEAANSSEPVWLHVCLSRTHAVEYPEPIFSNHLHFSLQGSEDRSNFATVLTPKDSPLSRYLEREVKWSNIYTCRVLLQHRKMEGGQSAIILLMVDGISD